MARRSQLAKRILDLSAVLLAAPLWLPLLGGVAVLVRFRLGRPVFFRQQRPGRDAKIFALLKFRTMTEARTPEGRLRTDAERLTPFGALLRSTSLDEIPAFFNVLRGQMSLVGPRPLLVDYLPLYSPREARRHEVLPGITGWAQINGRNALSWAQKFELDLWYVEHGSLLLDLRILFLTMAKVFRREGIAASGDATMPRFVGSIATPAPTLPGYTHDSHS